MSELRKIIVEATTEMLDSPDEHGIYPTTKFYNRLENDLLDHFIKQSGEPTVIHDDAFAELILNLSKQTTLTGRLQNAIATYLEYQSHPVMTINPVKLNLGKELE